MAKKHTKNIHHEYTSIKQLHHGFLFRMSNYFVLLSMILIQYLIHKFAPDFPFEFPESMYLIVGCAIIGYDLVGFVDIIKNFMGKRK